MSNVLGISCFYHDAAAALLQDGQIALAAQEERYTRRKIHAGFAARTLRDTIRATGIRLADIEAVAYYENPWAKFGRVLQQMVSGPSRLDAFLSAMLRWSQRNLRIAETLREQIGQPFKGRIYCTEHHGAHAASTFYPSPFDEAAILTLDGEDHWNERGHRRFRAWIRQQHELYRTARQQAPEGETLPSWPS